MKFTILFSLFICVLYYSCNYNRKDNLNNGTSKVESNYTNKIKTRDIHEIDSLEKEDKIHEEEKIDPALLATWNKFITIANNKNYRLLKEMSFDSIEVCHTTYNIDKFIQTCLPKVFDKELLNRFSEISYSTYLENRVIPELMPQFLIKQVDTINHRLILYQFQVLKELTEEDGWTMTFDFVKTQTGYKFYACDSFGGPICCR